MRYNSATNLWIGLPLGCSSQPQKDIPQKEMPLQMGVFLGAPCSSWTIGGLDWTGGFPPRPSTLPLPAPQPPESKRLLPAAPSTRAPQLTAAGLPSLSKVPQTNARSSSREVGIRVPFLSVVYFSRGTLPKKFVKGHSCGT